MDYRARVISPGVLRIIANNLPDWHDGETVFVSVERGRSGNSHRHQFAWLHDAWHSLPESEQNQPYAETPETLRKHALIATGYNQTAVIDCGANATALRIKAHMIAAETRAHGYALAQVRGTVLTVWTPESQSVRAMGGERFQASKTAIMDWIAANIGVTADDLRKVTA